MAYSDIVNEQIYGGLREAYDSGRLGYPADVISHVTHKLRPSAWILDLGCGTGISTRQLVEAGILQVSGCDSDLRMVQIARKRAQAKTEFFVAMVNDLPCKNGRFDGMTAFGAFHWFRDRGSIAEIRRVLVPRGWFSVVNKNDVGQFRLAYGDVIQSILGDIPAGPRVNYDPKAILSDAGFSQTDEEHFLTEEVFSIDQALVFVQSTRSWKYVPTNRQEQVLERMRDAFTAISSGGLVRRELKVTVVRGQN